MGSTYRLIVPGEGPESAELRLGNYAPGDEGFPPNYADYGDVTETTGVLMTTKGEYALVSGKTAFTQIGKGVAIQVAGGGFDLEATDDFTLTTKSLYLQSAQPVSTDTPPLSVPGGQVTIVTAADLKLHSHSADVKVLCKSGGYSTTMTDGWLEVWGNADDSSGTDTGIKLAETIEIPIVWNFNYDGYWCLIRGVHTVITFNESEAAVFSSTATGTEFGVAEIKNRLHAISTGASLLKTRVTDMISRAVAIDYGDFSIEITEEDIMSDLTGASNQMNAAPQINTE